MKDNLRRVDDGAEPAETLLPSVERKVGPVLRRYGSRFTPALVHADCNPKNGVLTESGGLVLVDWDEAVAAFWVWDYAGLTYWYSHMREGGGRLGDAGADEARASFFRAYGEPGFRRGGSCASWSGRCTWRWPRARCPTFTRSATRPATRARARSS